MQLRRLALVLGLAGMLFVNLAQALGLGDITIKSSLNEPLNAEIRLLQAGGLSQSEILVSMASPEAFEQVGVERIYFLNEIRFTVDMRRQVIKVTSQQPVKEPYLNFLVEVQWPSGRLVREYTTLLDIPAFTTKRQPTIEAPQTNTARSTPRTTNRAPVNRTPVDSYTVRSGDTLWEIAERVRPSNDVTVYQTMMGLFRANPEAFVGGNINNLRKGQELKVPKVDEIKEVSHQEAKAQAAQQHKEWRQQSSQPGAVQATKRETAEAPPKSSEPSGSVRVAGSDSSSGDAQALAESQEENTRLERENEELKERLAALEAQREQTDALIAKQKEELERLANLNAGLNTEVAEPNETDPEASPNTETTSPETVAEDPSNKVEETSPFVETPDTSTETEAEATESKVTEPEEEFNPYIDEPTLTSADYEKAKQEIEVVKEEPKAEVVETPKKEEVPAPEEASTNESEGFVDKAIAWIKDNLIIVGGVAVLLLLLIVLLLRRGKDEDAEELNFSEEDLYDESEAETQHFPTGVEDLEDEIQSFDSDDVTQYEEESNSVESETEDAVAEAEIYSSLGQLDKAYELLSREVEANPDNSDARLGLLKIYVEQNDLQAFDDQYAQLLTVGDDAAIHKARSLRDHFDGAPAFNESSYAVDSTVLDNDLDLDLESGIDSDDTGFETSAVDDELSLDLDLDLSDLEDSPSTDLEEDLESVSFEEGVETLVDEASELEDEVDDLGDELSLDELSNELDSLDDATPGDIVLDDGGLDLEDDFDLDLDLSDDASVSEADDTVVAPFESESSLDLDDELEQSLELESELGLDDESELDFDSELDAPIIDASVDEDDLESLGDLSSASDHFASMDDDLSSMDDDMDLDLDVPPETLDMDSLDQELEAMTADLGGIESDLEDDTPDVEEQAFEEAIQTTVSSTSMVDDDDLSFLNDADEVATKLGLAKAYVDMGDREGAEEILKEVLEEGTPAQQTEAKKLLEAI